MRFKGGKREAQGEESIHRPFSRNHLNSCSIFEIVLLSFDIVSKTKVKCKTRLACML